jgi:serine/threonine protein kinase
LSTHANMTMLLHVAGEIAANNGLTIGDSIGSGAFKDAYMAISPDGRQFAVKVVRNAGLCTRTEREISAITSCDHPGIPKLLYSGEHQVGTDRYVYVVEEYLSGGSLSSHLKTGLLDRSGAIRLAVELSDVLRHLNSKKLVHRDIKPDNIVYRTASGPAVLIDFGLVRDLSMVSETKSWALRGPGTPYFAAPEQLNNEKRLIDWRTDQFCLAATISVSHLGVHPYALVGEPLYDSRCVERVASRSGPSAHFVKLAENSHLGVLIKMVQPWSVARYRDPEGLLQDINKLR